MDFSTITVLLVEDNEHLRRMIARSLGVLGCKVAQAANAEDALRQIEGGQACDLLLSDLRMPGDVDGVALADRVVALRPGTRVLLQTGYYENLSERYPLLHKPYTLDELIAAIESACSH
jgi:CheY-like chemotaxis protein